MTFRVSPRETIRKCTAYDNKFRTYPEEARIKAFHVEKAKIDGQESPEMKKERELMEKFNNGQFLINEDKAALIAQIGKGILLIIVMPPLLTFYVVPKWVITHTAPLISQAAENIADFVKRGMIRISETVGDFFASAYRKLLSIIRNLLEGPKSQTQSFKELIQHEISKIFESIKKGIEILSKPFIYLKNKVEEKAVQAYEKVVEVLNKIAAPFIKLNNYISEKIQNRISEIKEVYENLVDRIKNSLPSFKLPSFQLADKDSAFLEHAKNIIKKLSEIPEAISSVVQAAVHHVHKQLDPYINWVFPVWNFIQTETKDAYTFTLRKVAQTLERGAEALKAAFEKVQSGMIWSAQKLRNFALTKANQFMRKLDQHKEKGRRAKEWIKAKAQKLIKKLAHRYENILSGLSSIGKFFGRHLKRAFIWIYNQAIILPKRLLAFGAKILNNLFTFMTHFGRALYTVFILFKVMFKLSFRAVRAFTEKALS